MPVNEIALAQCRSSAPLDDRSRALRRLVVDALAGGQRGHIGSSMSMIEVIRVLYDDVLRVRPDDPMWEGRDRFILSKGHGCLALYAVLADKGFFPIETLKSFCRAGSILGGHPERGKVPGVEASTGSLGHGLSIGVGMALALRQKQSDRRVFVLQGDGEINEGSVWEAAMSASKHRLSNLTALVDYNKIQSAGPTVEILDLEPLMDKWTAFGFRTEEIDGHDIAAVKAALLDAPADNDQPRAIICHTIKGRGISFAEHDPAWHHKSNISEDVTNQLYQALEAW